MLTDTACVRPIWRLIWSLYRGHTTNTSGWSDGKTRISLQRWAALLMSMKQSRMLYEEKLKRKWTLIYCQTIRRSWLDCTVTPDVTIDEGPYLQSMPFISETMMYIRKQEMMPRRSNEYPFTILNNMNILLTIGRYSWTIGAFFSDSHQFWKRREILQPTLIDPPALRVRKHRLRYLPKCKLTDYIM